MLRRTFTSLCCALALVVPVTNAMAVVRAVRSTKKVISETVTGTVVKCHKWGFLQLQLQVTKTEVVKGSKTNVSIKITNISWPVFPNHTPRSRYINAQALPLLQQETLQLQASAATNLENISGASQTSASWQTSLQAALLQAEKP